VNLTGRQTNSLPWLSQYAGGEQYIRWKVLLTRQQAYRAGMIREDKDLPSGAGEGRIRHPRFPAPGMLCSVNIKAQETVYEF